MTAFDIKFGSELIESVPSLPGVYMFSNAAGAVIYVGKSNNLRRRLSSYRKSGRRKRFAKVRKIVKDAASLTWEICATDADALLREDHLIKQLTPVWNFAGTFFATYPVIGIRCPADDDLELCLAPAAKATALSDSNFRIYGTFRDRIMTSEAFSALVELLELLGHKETNLRRRYKGLPKGISLAAFRRIDKAWVAKLEVFLSGDCPSLLPELANSLLDRVGARRKANEVQESLKALKKFYKVEPSLLARARSLGLIGMFVPCAERDQLTIRMQQT